jgi:hypothetical protein
MDRDGRNHVRERILLPSGKRGLGLNAVKIALLRMSKHRRSVQHSTPTASIRVSILGGNTITYIPIDGWYGLFLAYGGFRGSNGLGPPGPHSIKNSENRFFGLQSYFCVGNPFF